MEPVVEARIRKAELHVLDAPTDHMGGRLRSVDQTQHSEWWLNLSYSAELWNLWSRRGQGTPPSHARPPTPSQVTRDE